MKSVLIFPPGWMQFGPYLAPPLLKGYLESKGIEIDILDLNIEFYDWVLSANFIKNLDTRLTEREHSQGLLTSEYAKICKARLTFDMAHANIEQAKTVIRTPDLYIDHPRREWAKKTIGEALNIVEASFEKFRFSLNQIHFGLCGLIPQKVQGFLRSDQNIIKLFYEEKVSHMLDDYDFIGFSLPAWEQLVPSLTIIDGIRQKQKPVHICMGGNYVTRLVGTWNEQIHPFADNIDSFSLFEGEESLYQLLLALEHKQPLDHVPNLVFKQDEKLVHTPIETLDVITIPTPNFHGLQLEKYFCPETILPLYTSRSCPYKCAFCTIPYASSKFRQRDSEKVVDDIENLTHEYGTRLFTFVDETFTVPNLDRVSQGILARNLDVKWYGETRFSQRINRKLVKQAFEAGCRKLQFGLESYNQRVLDLMKKGTKVEHIQPNIDACLAEGIAVHLFTFLGFPGETEEEAQNTCTFSLSMMKLSEETYGNSFSTIGMGAFGLEVYSDVYYHPDRYGVSFNLDVKNSTGDEIFELDYSVKDGLNHREAENIVSEFQNKAIYDDLCTQTEQVSWHALAQKETNEEEAFLLYCLTDNATLNTMHSHEMDGFRAQYLCPEQGTFALKLAHNVISHPFAHDFLHINADANDVIAFYRPERDIVVNVPGTIGRQILDLVAGVERGDVNGTLYEYCNILLRNGLLEGFGDGVATYVTAEQMPPYDQAHIEANADVHLLRRKNGSFALFDTVTHDILVINATGAWIFSVVKQASGTMDMLLDTLVDTSKLKRSQIEALFLELIRTGVFLVRPALPALVAGGVHAKY